MKCKNCGKPFHGCRIMEESGDVFCSAKCCLEHEEKTKAEIRKCLRKMAELFGNGDSENSKNTEAKENA